MRGSRPASIHISETGAPGGAKLGPTLNPLRTHSTRLVHPDAATHSPAAKQVDRMMAPRRRDARWIDGVCIVLVFSSKPAQSVQSKFPEQLVRPGDLP